MATIIPDPTQELLMLILGKNITSWNLLYLIVLTTIIFALVMYTALKKTKIFENDGVDIALAIIFSLIMARYTPLAYYFVLVVAIIIIGLILSLYVLFKMVTGLVGKSSKLTTFLFFAGLIFLGYLIISFAAEIAAEGVFIPDWAGALAMAFIVIGLLGMLATGFAALASIKKFGKLAKSFLSEIKEEEEEKKKESKLKKLMKKLRKRKDTKTLRKLAKTLKKEFEELEKEKREVEERLKTIKDRCKKHTNSVLRVIKEQEKALKEARAWLDKEEIPNVQKWIGEFDLLQNEKSDLLKKEEKCVGSAGKLKKIEKIEIQKALKKLKAEERLTRSEKKEIQKELAEIKLNLKNLKGNPPTQEVIKRLTNLTRKLFVQEKEKVKFSGELLRYLTDLYNYLEKINKFPRLRKLLYDAIKEVEVLVKFELEMEDKIKELFNLEKAKVSNLTKANTNFLISFLEVLERHLNYERSLLVHLDRLVSYEKRYIQKS